MAEVLVLANETIGGQKLLDAIRERAAQGDARFHVVVPLTAPRYGNVVYDEALRESAQVRVDLALAFMRDEGIAGDGEVGDPDPLNAAKDAIPHFGITEIIVSTLPATSSGWLRRDLIKALEDQTGLPVKHVVIDLDREGLPFDVTVVLANRTAASGPLVERLKAKAAEGPLRIIVVVPQNSGQGHEVKAARERLKALLGSLDDAGIVAAGMIGDPDPYLAAMNVIQFFRVTDVVISTFPAGESKWLDSKVIERVEKESGKPVEHIPAPYTVPA